MFVFLLLLSFFSISSAASPEQQNCLNNLGHIVLVKARQPRPITYEFCYFQAEHGGMTTRALLQGRGNEYGGPDANRAYRSTPSQTFGACQRHAGTVFTGERDLNGKPTRVRICGFWDGSAIDDRALEDGLNSPWNQDLNRALNIF